MPRRGGEGVATGATFQFAFGLMEWDNDEHNLEENILRVLNL